MCCAWLELDKPPAYQYTSGADLVTYRDSHVNRPKVTRRFVTFSDTILAEHRGLTRGLQPWIAHPLSFHSSLETYGLTIRPTPATRIPNVQLNGGSMLSKPLLTPTTCDYRNVRLQWTLLIAYHH